MKSFSLPILIGIILAYFFPSFSLDLIKLPFFLLMLLMYLATLLSPSSFDHVKRINKTELFFSIFFFIFLAPFVQFWLSLLLIDDQKLIQGSLVQSLTPVALIAPMFTKKHKGDVSFSFILVFLSTLLAPLYFPFYLKVFNLGQWPISYTSFVKELLILTVVPIVLGVISKKILQNKIDKILKYVPLLNSVILAILIYVLFASVYLRVNWLRISKIDLAWVLVIGFLQDFGWFFFAKKFLRGFFVSREVFISFVISISMRNVALISSALLIYDPKSAMPAVFCFIPHLLFFEYIWRCKSLGDDLNT